MAHPTSRLSQAGVHWLKDSTSLVVTLISASSRASSASAAASLQLDDAFCSSCSMAASVSKTTAAPGALPFLNDCMQQTRSR